MQNKTGAYRKEDRRKREDAKSLSRIWKNITINSWNWYDEEGGGREKVHNTFFQKMRELRLKQQAKMKNLRSKLKEDNRKFRSKWEHNVVTATETTAQDTSTATAGQDRATITETTVTTATTKTVSVAKSKIVSIETTTTASVEKTIEQ